jgi:hypothetical protein
MASLQPVRAIPDLENPGLQRTVNSLNKILSRKAGRKQKHNSATNILTPKGRLQRAPEQPMFLPECQAFQGLSGAFRGCVEKSL